MRKYMKANSEINSKNVNEKVKNIVYKCKVEVGVRSTPRHEVTFNVPHLLFILKQVVFDKHLKFILKQVLLSQKREFQRQELP